VQTESHAGESDGDHAIDVVLSIAGGGVLETAVSADVIDADTGDATSGDDYAPFGTQTVTFNPGAATGATQSVTLSITPDDDDEPDETVGLALTNPHTSSELGATAAYTVTILDDDEPDPAPVVREVLSLGGAWAPSFVTNLDTQGLGDGGFALAADGSAGPLPWSNIDRIIVRFSEVVNATAGDLILAGVNVPLYTIDSVIGSGTDELIFVLAAPIGVDKLLIDLQDTITDAGGNALDGENLGAHPSGDGTPGGDFEMRFDVLPGDINRSGTVAVSDIGPLRTGLGSSAGDANYSPFADLNGSGTIAVSDIGPLRTNLGQSLPDDDPTSPDAPAPLTVTTPTAEMLQALLRGEADAQLSGSE